MSGTSLLYEMAQIVNCEAKPCYYHESFDDEFNSFRSKHKRDLLNIKEMLPEIKFFYRRVKIPEPNHGIKTHNLLLIYKYTITKNVFKTLFSLEPTEKEVACLYWSLKGMLFGYSHSQINTRWYQNVERSGSDQFS